MGTGGRRINAASTHPKGCFIGGGPFSSRRRVGSHGLVASNLRLRDTCGSIISSDTKGLAVMNRNGRRVSVITVTQVEGREG